MEPPFDIFLAAPPGLETALRDEAAALGLAAPAVAAGGVAVRGGWPEVRRAALWLRGASRVLVRMAEFRAAHLAQLDKRARRVDWAALLRPDVPVAVEATCRRSRIYHERAAAQRIAAAIADATGAPVAGPGKGPGDGEDALRVLARIEDDLVSISVDAAGEPLHRRGHKQAVGKAPLRESMAAPFLRACGFDGTGPVVDPMCGSGTLVIEAAEIAAGLAPGRSRAFAFERLAGHDAAVWAAMRDAAQPSSGGAAPGGPARFFGYDRDAGAVAASTANAARAGVAALTRFAAQPVSALAPPPGPPGLVIVNPPYGARIGEAGDLRALYGALGKTLAAGFAGWRVGLITSEPALARAAGLPFEPPGPPVPHGPLKIRLYRAQLR